jgi:hypothetical protein
MLNNPQSKETMSAQPTDVIAKGEQRMADLPPRPVAPSRPPASFGETPAEVERVETRQEEARTVRYAIGKLNDFLQWFTTVLAVTLVLRFILKLIGADPANLFTGFLYALTDIILFPFNSMVGPSRFSPNGRAMFEWSTIIAILIYWMIFWAIRRFLRILISGPEEPAT